VTALVVLFTAAQRSDAAILIDELTPCSASLAAAANTQIAPEHIAHAARAEFARLGMPPADIDLS